MKIALTLNRWTLGLLLLAAGGCGEPSNRAETSPSTATQSDKIEHARDAILEQQLAVDTLYFSETGTQFVAPGNRQRATVEPASGQLGWAAWQCDNPQCPGRLPDGKPLLFPWKDSFVYLQENGAIGVRQPETEAELRQAQENAEVKCPACLKQRNLATETAEKRAQYRNWCRLHVLPQAQEQRRKLAEQYRQLLGGT